MAVTALYKLYKPYELYKLRCAEGQNPALRGTISSGTDRNQFLKHYTTFHLLYFSFPSHC